MNLREIAIAVGLFVSTFVPNTGAGNEQLIVSGPAGIYDGCDTTLARAIDEVQYAAWLVADQYPTDAMLEWQYDLYTRLQEIECHLCPQECQ